VRGTDLFVRHTTFQSPVIADAACLFEAAFLNVTVAAAPPPT
jgi:hypothetical protein